MSKKEVLEKSRFKSLSAMRHFIRYAMSSIAYHKLVPLSNEKGRIRDGWENDDLIQDNSVKNNLNNHGGAGDRLKCAIESCFIEKNFYGVDNLKYIDAVDEDEMIKDENVYKITKWLEQVAFPYLERNMLQSLNFGDYLERV